MALLFEEFIKDNKEAFKLKLIEIAGKLAINPNWLMWVMKSESGLNPQAQNTKYLVHGQPATGLIQFIDTTAAYLGTSIPALYNMNSVEQLEYVYKYFKPYAGKMKSIYDVYSVVFFPAALGKPDSWQFQTKGLSPLAIAKANPIFDLNKDGVITIAEFKKAIDNRIKIKDRPAIFSPIVGGSIVGLLLLFTVGALLYYKNQ